MSKPIKLSEKKAKSLLAHLLHDYSVEEIQQMINQLDEEQQAESGLNESKSNEEVY